jgi:FtsZ-interacting cell division protein ZipA
MDTNAWIVIVILLVGVIIFLVALLLMQRRRSQQLQTRFGPEYDRAVRQYGDQKHAEEELAARERRVTRFRIVPLSRDDAARFAEAWQSVQNRFVDDPHAAVQEADQKVRELMQRRGYPVADFEQQAADLSVDHPIVVENYRTAHQIALRNEGGTASTEELRKAVVHYRAIFDELLEVGKPRQPIRASETEPKGGLRQWRLGKNLFRRQI